MHDIRTVSDTTRAFYAAHSRPISPLYRRAIEELMVEMHLLSVNVEFSYDPIYALGVTMAFDRFTVGYQPEADRDSIFRALCQGIGSQAEQYRQDADRLLGAARATSRANIIAALTQAAPIEPGDAYTTLQQTVEARLHQDRFKYSRPYAIGLYALLEASQGDVPDETVQKEAWTAIAESLKLPLDKLQKDLELYRSSLEKIAQLRETAADIIEAERRKRELREQAKAAATQASEAKDSSESSTTNEPSPGSESSDPEPKSEA